MKYLFPLIMVLFLAASCQEPKAVTGSASTGGSKTLITDESFRKLTTDKELYTATTETVLLDTAYAIQDTLHIITQKMNACNASSLKMMWNGMMMKSLPPQTTLRLLQMTEADCREKHKFHITYNIIPLRFKQDTGSSTIIRIGGWKGSVKYEF